MTDFFSPRLQPPLNLSLPIVQNSRAVQMQPLTFPLPLRCPPEQQKKLLATLQVTKSKANEYLQVAYTPETLQILKKSGKKAYKVLEYELAVASPKFPSRINRGILEIVGRTLRAISERKGLFDELVNLGIEPRKWDYSKLISKKNIYAKAQYVQNLKEQVLNYEKEHKKIPQDFFSLQACPKLHKPILTYAPDDDQALRMELEDKQLKLRLKVICDEEQNKWEWMDLNIPLPDILRTRAPLSPDLRLDFLHGQWLPVLDYKLQHPCPPYKKTRYFLTVDWGTRKLLTICVFDRDGRQITKPIFLKFDPLLKKLLRIRREIDHLKAKRDKLSLRCSLWYKYNREIAKRWRKFRAINRALAHLASNVVVIIARIFNCSDIYVENLKNLKSKKFSNLLNWIINSTVRQAIYDRLAYKARIGGAKLQKPVPPFYTSQYCPRCGAKGHHIKSPQQKEEIVPEGGWFLCPQCGFNADRDYIGCLNIARKVLYGNSLKKNHDKVVVYTTTAISELLFRQSRPLTRERLLRHLNGWRSSVYLKPYGFFAGVLRS